MELLKTYARADLIHPALYELMAYDEKNHAELTDTLEAYLLCRHNYVKTAERLCIHRNTLLYRLKRIGSGERGRGTAPSAVLPDPEAEKGVKGRNGGIRRIQFCPGAIAEGPEQPV